MIFVFLPAYLSACLSDSDATRQCLCFLCVGVFRFPPLPFLSTVSLPEQFERKKKIFETLPAIVARNNIPASHIQRRSLACDVGILSLSALPPSDLHLDSSTSDSQSPIRPRQPLLLRFDTHIFYSSLCVVFILFSILLFTWLGWPPSYYWWSLPSQLRCPLLRCFLPLTNNTS